MRLGKETRMHYSAMAACLAVACLLRWYGHTFQNTFTEVFSLVCYTALFLIWMRLLRQRFIRREVTTCLTALAGLMIAWKFAQSLKFDAFFMMPDVVRWLWYVFYVPIAFMPPLLLIAMLYVGKPADWHVGRRWWLLFAAAGALSLLVLTNDLHQLVFRFIVPIDQMVSAPQSEQYVHGPGFFLAWAWAVVLGALSVVVLIKRSVRSGLLWRALIPLAIAVAIGVLVPAIDKRQFHMLFLLFSFTDSACILMLVFVESLIALGFFPTNSGYRALWRASSLNGGFMDSEGRPCDLSAGAPDVDAAQVREALARPVPLGDGRSELVARQVTGGTAFWSRDLSTVRMLSEKLEDLGDELVQEREILNSELKLAHDREALAHRQELYEQVSSNTASQLAALEEALDSMPEDEEEFLAAMRIAAVYAAYIKRSANLTFLGARGFMDARELVLAYEETCACLRELGADVAISVVASGNLCSDEVLQAYAAFEQLVEDALPRIEKVRIEGAVEGDALIVRCSVRGEKNGSCSSTLHLAGDAA